jgi:hypothetical protein
VVLVVHLVAESQAGTSRHRYYQVEYSVAVEVDRPFYIFS